MRIVSLLLCVVLLESAGSFCFAQDKPEEDRRVKDLEMEKKRITSPNPEDRAKAFMRIAEITLSYVSDGAKVADGGKVELYIGAYERAVTDARDTMMNSGLDPHKKSGGYRAVEIALRRQMRSLGDIAKTLSLDNRRPVQEAIDMVSRVRDEFMHALFN